MASLRTLCKMRFKKNTIRIDFRDNQTKKIEVRQRRICMRQRKDICH